jgi:hypothetical protein
MTINLSSKISKKFLRNLQRAEAEKDRKLRLYAITTYLRQIFLLRAAQRDAVRRKMVPPHAVIYEPDAQAEVDRQIRHLLREYEAL